MQLSQESLPYFAQALLLQQSPKQLQGVRPVAWEIAGQQGPEEELLHCWHWLIHGLGSKGSVLSYSVLRLQAEANLQVKYADHFVMIHAQREVVELCIEKIISGCLSAAECESCI